MGDRGKTEIIWLIFVIGYVGDFGQHLIVPFIISVVVWYLLNSLGDLFGKIKM